MRTFNDHVHRFDKEIKKREPGYEVGINYGLFVMKVGLTLEANLFPSACS